VFLDMLRAQGIESVVDVRSQPGSSTFPHFNAEAMTDWLADERIGYRHAADLGGRRPKQHDVDPQLNAGWLNSSFRNYADWTLSEAYVDALAELMTAARDARTVVMCAEALPWRCHRSIIASSLAGRGEHVAHIMDAQHVVDHEIGRWGPRPVVDGQQVTYPA
jgi:uncharacterized protein (DUF488 family)